MSSRRLTYALSLVFAFTIGVFAASALDSVVARSSASEDTKRPDMTIFWQAWDLAFDHFVYQDALKPDQMLYGAVSGMIDSLGDDGHSRFLTPEEVRMERSSLRGRFEGIGAEVNIKDGRPIIVAPMEGSPAERAGLRPGDTILAVNGTDVTSLSLTELTSTIRGPRGTTVTLTVLREGESSAIEVQIVRDEIRVPVVTWATVPGTTIAHLRINRFGRETTDELRDAIAAARAEGADRFVLDLRNNPGGLLDQAVKATSQFIGEGNVLLEEDADGERTPFPVVPGGVALDAPIVVLINKGSASASEIMAGAIQDADRGTVVGEKSFGTGTVLMPYNLKDGSQVYLGVAQWLTPAGRVIRKVGIEPDIVVELPTDVRTISPSRLRERTANEIGTLEDTQFLRAIELLQDDDVDRLPTAA